MKSIKTSVEREKSRRKKLIDFLLNLDEKDVKEKMKEIDEKIIVYEAELRNNQIEKFEVETMLNNFRNFISNMGDWWLNSIDIKRKQQIQKLIFPNNVFWDGEKFRTGKTPLFMRILSNSEDANRKWYPRRDSNARPFP